MSQLQQAQPLLAELETLISSRNASNAGRIADIISQLKRIVFLLPSNDPSTKNKVEAELIASRRFHELCILYSIESKNVKGFESAITYLRTYYENYPQLPVSSDRNQIVALHLLYLLSFNKHREYHSQVELVSVEDATKNTFIHFVTHLERQLAIGNYSEVLLAKNNSPLPQFNFFLDRIFETIRFETARSAEKAYSSLSLQEAVQVFNLNNIETLREFISQQSKHEEDTGYIWSIAGDRLTFTHKDANNTQLYNSESLIATALSYAHEIEKIV